MSDQGVADVRSLIVTKAASVGADDQIRLPVTEAATLSHDGRAQIVETMVGDGAASLTAP